MRKLHPTILPIFFAFLAVQSLATALYGAPTGSREAYLGQRPPGKTPELFAPGIVSTDGPTEYCVAIDRDGGELYFNRAGTGIMVCTLGDTGWSDPAKAPFTRRYIGGEVHITHDGKRLLMNRHRGLAEGDQGGIWALQRRGGAWSDAVFVLPMGMRATSTREGVIFTTDITGFKRDGMDQGVIARYIPTESGYTRAPDPAGGVNSEHNDSHPFIAPDESYVIFNSDRPGGKGRGDLYICYRLGDGSWSDAVNLAPLNTPYGDWCATVTADGKYLFFTRNITGMGDIYWVDTAVLTDLRPAGLD